MLAVFERSEATLASRLVLLAMADHAHDDGSNAFAAVPTLARKAKVKRRAVQRAIRWAERECEIVWTKDTTKRGVRIYHMAIVEPFALSIEGRHPVTGGASERREGGVIVTPEPSVEPSSKRTPTSGVKMTPLDEPTPIELVENVLASRSTRDVQFVTWLRGVGPILADSPRNFADELASTWGVRSLGVVEIYRQVALGATIEDLKDEGRGFE